jgi:hypothetical protein
MFMARTYSIGLMVLGALASWGCSFSAKKTPTPAAQLDGKQLARLPVPQNERYYLIFFGSQDALHRPKYCHTWATLVKLSCCAGAANPTLEVHTISWLPVTNDIRPLSREVEPGANFELHDTIKSMLANKEKIIMWGPYEVSYPFSIRFLTQKAFLDSGAVGYQCNDVVGEAARTGDGCDCIHAVSDMDPVYPRWRYPLALYGAPATADLVRRFMHSPIFIDPRTTHDWLVCRIGLDQYPIRRRTYIGRADEFDPDGTDGDLDGNRPRLRSASPPQGSGPATPPAVFPSK